MQAITGQRGTIVNAMILTADPHSADIVRRTPLQPLICRMRVVLL